MSKTAPPQPNELELSLFGPGIGECAVVHLGNGDWMVVDSCRGSDGKRSVALDYFAEMGIDVAHKVKLVVVTHWHDDHVRGLAQLVRQASSAQFACSDALRCEEFLTLVAADREVALVEHSSGVSEFADVLDILTNRSTTKYAIGPDHWASEGSRLYYAPERNVEVWALSPSHQTITDSKGKIAALIPSTGETIRRFCPPEPNDLSVAIMVTTPGVSFLLGGDLEKGRDRTRGWSAVIESNVNPKQQSHIYKVAHHGSVGADRDDIWTKMLVNQAYAMLTPYARGRAPLPSSEDVARMKRYSSNLYCTAWPPTKAPPRRDAAVERTIKEMTKAHRALRKRPGHIRVRIPFSGNVHSDTSVELFDDACLL